MINYSSKKSYIGIKFSLHRNQLPQFHQKFKKLTLFFFK
jgi:hypothetical protein